MEEDKVKARVEKRPKLKELRHLEKARVRKLYRMVYEHGPGNGTFLGLPFDQLVEHGPAHEFKWERSAKPESVIELANKGNFSALVLSVGQSQKYQHDIDPKIPLIVKLDGHFYTGKDNQANYPRHTMFGSVEDAIRVGADGVGLTFYLASEQTGEDIERIGKVRDEAHKNGLLLVLWSYPRGPVPDKTKADSLLWCHYAVSAAESLGADIVKTKFPSVVEPKKRKAYEEFILKEYAKKISEAEKYIKLEPEEKELLKYEESLKGEKPNYDSLISFEQHVERASIVVGAAGRTMVIFSGGAKVKGEAKKALEDSTRIIMDAGGEGRIIGRNFWGVPIEEGLELSNVVTKIMKGPQYRRVF